MLKSFLLIFFSIVLAQGNLYGSRIVIKNKLLVEEFDFYVDTVILVQEEQKVIGHLQKHKKLKKLRLKEKRIDLALQNLFQNSYPIKEGKRRLILKVNRIIFNVFDRSSEFGANITFIEKVNDNLIELGTIETFVINENTIRPVLKAPYRGLDLVVSIESLLDKFLEHVEEQDDHKVLSKSDINKPIEINKNSYPIIEKPKHDFKGVILSYDDFKNGKVSKDSSLEYETIEFKKTSFFKLKVKSEKYDNEDLWGVYDGENYFINERNFFRPLIFQNNSIFIHAPSRGSGFIDEVPGITSFFTSFIASFALSSNLDFGPALAISVGSGLVVYFITRAIINGAKKYVYYELDLLTGLAVQLDVSNYPKIKTQ